MPESWSPLQFALALPHMVGREDPFNTIVAHIPPVGFKVFYLHGQGGIGKTRLEQEILKYARDAQTQATGLIVFSEPIDFYHYPVHSIDGLMRAIRAVLPQHARTLYFDPYDDALNKAQEAQRKGNVERATEWYKNAKVYFEDGFFKLTQAHPLVMAFDTLEVLGRVDPQHDILSWLFDRLQQANKGITLLLAGRPSPGIETFLKQRAGSALQNINVGALSQEAIGEYLGSLSELLKEQGHAREADRLKNLTAEDRERLALLTGGRPIFLALVTECFLSAGQWPEIFQKSLDELRAMSPEQLRELQEEARTAILGQLWALRDPWRSTLELLALTTKGMSQELLAALQNIDENEAADRLERLTHLTLIKQRPFESELRVYLHDELYALLNESYPNPQTRANNLRKIAEWYGQKRQELLDRIRNANQQQDPVREWVQKLQQVQIEQVHYLLRWQWQEGLAQFVEYSIDAFTAWNPILDGYLQSEVRDYAESVSEEQVRAPLLWELKLAQVRQELLKGNKREAGTLLEDLQHEIPGPLHEAHWNIWKGNLFLEEAHYREAIEAFEKAETILSGCQDESRFVRRLKIVLYNSKGYALRLQFRNRLAADTYRKAIPFIRALDNRYELSDLLKNLAFCLAESGEARDALSLIDDALELAQREGATYLEGLSRNTKAAILIRAGEPEDALIPARRALELFRSLDNARGEGLASLALANAYRRMALKVNIPRQQREHIEQARQEVEKAVEIFTSRYNEPIRRIETFIEAGCVLRDRIRIEREGFGVPPSWLRSDPELAEKARGYFLDAIQPSQTIPSYYLIDAQINLALLELYLENFQDVKSWLEKAEATVEQAYRLTPGGPYPPAAGEEGVWLALGKLYMTRAQMLWRRQGSDDLARISEYLTLAMAYDELFSPDSFGAQRGQDAVYRVLKKTPYHDLQTIYREAWRTAHQYNLPRSLSHARNRTLMIRFLERNFGPSEAYLSPEELKLWATE